MPEIAVRRLRAGEEEAYIRSVRIPFLDPATESSEDQAWMERAVRRTETGRCYVAEEAGRFVANCGVRTMDVTVPGSAPGDCPVIPMGGVTAVGVHPTHRRRGILRRMMRTMLDDCRQRGEPVAGLIASESVIYGRFGFGLASDYCTLEIDAREAAMLQPAPELDLHLLERDETAKVLPDLFDRQRRGRAGEPGRSGGFWEEYLADEPTSRPAGGHARFVAACDGGYVSYRAVENPSPFLRDTIVVDELRGLTPDVEAGLWNFVLGIDLTDQVTARRRPVDEPLRWRLADPRQLRVTEIQDRLHLRLLDVPAALERRGYEADGRLVLDVVARGDDGTADPAAGPWLLEAGPGGASCRRPPAGRSADLRLDLTALGSIYMGGYRASVLAAAGRIAELTPGSLRVADHLFAATLAPLSGTGF